jgi:uncharacterized protein YlbG (UPF0298 family)
MHAFAGKLRNFGDLEIRTKQGGYTKYFVNDEFVTKIPHTLNKVNTGRGIISDILGFLKKIKSVRRR